MPSPQPSVALQVSVWVVLVGRHDGGRPDMVVPAHRHDLRLTAMAGGSAGPQTALRPPQQLGRAVREEQLQLRPGRYQVTHNRRRFRCSSPTDPPVMARVVCSLRILDERR